MKGQNSHMSITVIREIMKELYKREDNKVKAFVATKVAASQDVPLSGYVPEDTFHTPQQLRE
jgi:hypothetical protein